MLDFSILSSAGSLAYAPFCLDNNNEHTQKQTHAYTEQLIESFYFNGSSSSDGNTNILNEKCAVVNNNDELVDIGFTNTQWSLEDFLLGGNDASLVSRAAVACHVSPVSPAALSSNGSLDDLLDDLDIATPYGSPALNGSPYGSPAANGSSYGSPVANGSPYGSPAANGSSYGSPAANGSPYGSPAANGSPYGSPAANGSPCGSPAANGSPYGSPAANGSLYWSPTATGSPYGSPTANGSPYGSPTANGSPYGSPYGSPSVPSPLGSYMSSGSPLGSPTSFRVPSQSPTSSGSSSVSYGSPTHNDAVCPFDDLLDDLTSSFTSPVAVTSLEDFVEHMDVQTTTTTNANVGMSLGVALSNTVTTSYPNTHAAVVGEQRPSTTLDGISIVEMLRSNSLDSGVSSSDEINVTDVNHNVDNVQLGDGVGLLELLSYCTPANQVSNFDDITQQQISHLTESPTPSESTPSPRFAPYKGKGGERKERTEEQKQRKKGHNRKSATKYRTKKKQEQNEKGDVLGDLEEKNRKLKTNVEDLRKEIDYLKSLMIDVIKAGASKNKKNERCLEELLAAGMTN